MLIGWRQRKLSTIVSNPWPTHRARSPEAACAGVAPAPAKPVRTTAKALAKPTTAARSPAVTGCTREGRSVMEAREGRTLLEVTGPPDPVRIGSNVQLDIGCIA